MDNNLCLYITGKKKAEIREERISQAIDSNDVIVDIKACGICGSDLEFIDNYNLKDGNGVILGHEIVGSTKLKENEVSSIYNNKRLVVIKPSLSCNSCYQCAQGRYNLCENLIGYGRDGVAGGFRKRMIVPNEVCYTLPMELESEVGVLVEPLAVCLNGIKMSGFMKGMNVAVIGCGTLGIILIKLLKSMGAEKIFSCDTREISNRFAERYGANYVSNVKKENFLSMILAHTKDKGVHLVFETSGNPMGIDLAVGASMAGGEIILLSKPISKYINMRYYEMFKKGLRLKIIRGFNDCFEESIELLKCELDLKEIITHKLSLEEAKEFIQNYGHYRDKVLKAVIIP